MDPRAASGSHARPALLTMKAVIDFPGRRQRLRHAFDEPREILQAEDIAEVPRVIARADRCARDGAWVLGLVSYEAAPAFDRAMRVHAPVTTLPLACFAVYDRPSDEGPAVAVPAAPYLAGNAWTPTTNAPRAMARMAQIRDAIARGAVYQVNLTTRLRAPFAGDAQAFFHDLRRAQPDGYGLYLDARRWRVLSVSPELFFDWSESGALTTRPMKGTAPRHDDPVRDAAAARAMRESAKERAENLMIVDLLRNDLSRLAHPGSVQVPALFEAEALPTAWQMTSTVRCRTRDGLDLADIFAALFPCGSVTGAPKIAAMAAIHALEDEARGVYCGALGVIRPGGHATFSVGIRTLAIDPSAGLAECGVGSGITWDSQPADEWAEWAVKQRFLARAAALAARGGPDLNRP